MHAYLLISQNSNKETPIASLAKKLRAKVIEFPIQKIDDVRSLNNLIRLSFSQPTLIVCQNVHLAGEEALNAFLKNLEEPQENIYFALTSTSTAKVLPTVVSRCQIIRVKNTASLSQNGESEKFIKMTTAKKLAFLDKVKKRDEALEFVENLLNYLHQKLHTEEDF